MYCSVQIVCHVRLTARCCCTTHFLCFLFQCTQPDRQRYCTVRVRVCISFCPTRCRFVITFSAIASNTRPPHRPTMSAIYTHTYILSTHTHTAPPCATPKHSFHLLTSVPQLLKQQPTRPYPALLPSPHISHFHIHIHTSPTSSQTQKNKSPPPPPCRSSHPCLFPFYRPSLPPHCIDCCIDCSTATTPTCIAHRMSWSSWMSCEQRCARWPIGDGIREWKCSWQQLAS